MSVDPLSDSRPPIVTVGPHGLTSSIRNLTKPSDRGDYFYQKFILIETILTLSIPIETNMRLPNINPKTFLLKSKRQYGSTKILRGPIYWVYSTKIIRIIYTVRKKAQESPS